MRTRTLGVGLVGVAVGVGLFLVLVADGDPKPDPGLGAQSGPTTTSTGEATGSTADALVEPSLEELVGTSGLGDPDDVELPESTGEAKAWLEREGAAARDLVVAAEPLWAMGIAACEPVADVLDAIGTPEEVTAAAGGTPDGPTQEILLGLQRATETALQSCADPETFETARAELAWQWALADRRVTELGVAR